MFYHVVMWKLKDENKLANMAEVIRQLKEMEHKVEVIRSLKVGRNTTYFDAEAFYDICLIVEFQKPEDHALYRTHPEHLKVSKFVTSVVEKRAVVNFEEE